MPHTSKAIPAPLSGICVLDLSRLLPGAYCSKQLSDLGARVIKVEEPGVGDFYREQPQGALFSEETFDALNSGKESLSLNLKSEAGRQVLWSLIRNADILLENFRPGKMKSLGFSYRKLKRVNPGLILCSMTGYGQTGPRSQQAGHDLNYVGLAGLLHTPDGVPRVPPIQVADLAGGGLFGAVAILSALVERERSGRGTWIDLALTEGALSLASPYLDREYGAEDSGGDAFELLGGKAASYQLYKTKDERWVALAPLESKFWKQFVQVSRTSVDADSGMGREVMASRITNKIKKIVRSRTLRQWMRCAAKADICLTPVHSHQSVFSEAQFKSRRLFYRRRQISGRWRRGVKSPFVFNGRRSYRARRAPKIGEHNLTILKELGYHEEQVRQMRAQKIL